MDIRGVIEQMKAAAEQYPLGDWIETEAARQGADPYELAREMLYTAQSLRIPGIGTGKELVEFMVGHVHADKTSVGPRPGCADIVIVGKHPGIEEADRGELFVGPSGVELYEGLKEAGIGFVYHRAYMTNACRFLPPRGSKTIKATWLKQCKWFLMAELNIIKPKYVLLLGAEAIQMFSNKKVSVSRKRDIMEEFTLLDGTKTQIFATTHPAAVLRDVGMRQGFLSDLASFGRKANLVTAKKKADVNYQIIHEVDDLKALVDALLAEKVTDFALDCEWNGERCHSPGSYLLTIQFSWAPGKAAIVVLKDHAKTPVSALPAGTVEIPISIGAPHVHFMRWTGEDDKGVPITKSYVTYDDDPMAECLDDIVPSCQPHALNVVEELQRLFLRPEVAVYGHNFKADFPWLKSKGIDLTDQFLNGFDTMLAHHMLFETGEQGLDAVMLKYTDMGRTDYHVHSWLDATKKYFPGRAGFSDVPSKLLHVYGGADADGTFRIMQALRNELTGEESKKYKTHGCGAGLWKLFKYVVMPSNLGVIEMEANGFPVDEARLMELSKLYHKRREELVSRLRTIINWPDFNFRSVLQVRELLFGEELTGKRDKDGKSIRVRPPGAMTLGLTPLKTTGKPARNWSDVERRGETDRNQPSTDSETLGILSDQHPAAQLLQNIKFVDQICKNFLPVDDNGAPTGGGLLGCILNGRIHTTLLQILETGRWASTKPNLQNLPKKQEYELKRIVVSDLPEEVKKKTIVHSIRSCFVPDPGYVLVTSDFESAELVTLAYIANDQEFIDVLTTKLKVPVLVDAANPKNILAWLHPSAVDVKDRLIATAPEFQERMSKGGVIIPERRDNRKPVVVDRPVQLDFRSWGRDLHGELAIENFKLPYDPVLHGPPKGWVKSAGFEDFRTSQKTVNFGIPYGRGANAIARQLRKDGVDISVNDAQKAIDGFLQRYKGVAQYLLDCEQAVIDPGFLETPWGRRRRFRNVDDNELMAAQQREAKNFAIQSTVADAINNAVKNLWLYRYYLQMPAELRPDWVKEDADFKLLLAVHDELIMEVAIGSLDAFMTYVLPLCMRDMNEIPATKTTKSFKLGIDPAILLRWSEDPDPEQLKTIGVPAKFIKAA